MLLLVVFPADVATMGKPYALFASILSVFSDLKHNTWSAIDGGAFPSVPQALRSNVYFNVATSLTTVAPSKHCNDCITCPLPYSPFLGRLPPLDFQ